MEDIKTPKKFPIEREVERLFKYLAHTPTTKLELEDKRGFYLMIVSICLVIMAPFVAELY